MTFQRLAKRRPRMPITIASGEQMKIADAGAAPAGAVRG